MRTLGNDEGQWQTHASIKIAAGLGHLEVVRWLVLNMPDGRRFAAHDATSSALRAGHVDIAMFLLENTDTSADLVLFSAGWLQIGCTSADTTKLFTGKKA